MQREHLLWIFIFHCLHVIIFIISRILASIMKLKTLYTQLFLFLFTVLITDKYLIWCKVSTVVRFLKELTINTAHMFSVAQVTKLEMVPCCRHLSNVVGIKYQSPTDKDDLSWKVICLIHILQHAVLASGRETMWTITGYSRFRHFSQLCKKLTCHKIKINMPKKIF